MIVRWALPPYSGLNCELARMFIDCGSPWALEGEEGEELMKDFVNVEFDPGRSARPGLALLTL